MAEKLNYHHLNPIFITLLTVLILLSQPVFSQNIDPSYVYNHDDSNVSGSTHFDFVGSADLTIYGSPTTGAIGKFGETFDYDASDDYMKRTALSLLDTSSWTIETWVKSNTLSTGSSDVIFMNNAGTNNMGLHLRDGIFKGSLHDGSWHFSGSPSSQISTDTWYHLVLTWDSPNLLLYQDGVLVTASNTNQVNSADAELTIGANEEGSSASSFWNGSIDELYIYNSTFSQTNVTYSYNNGDGRVFPDIRVYSLVNITSQLYFNEINQRSMTLSFNNGDMTGAYLDVYDSNCYTLINKVSANNISDFLIINQTTLGEVPYTFIDTGFDLDNDNISDQIANCRRGAYNCPNDYADYTLIFNLSTQNNYIYSFVFNNNSDIPLSLISNTFDTDFISIDNGTETFGFFKLSGATSGSWTIEAGAMSLYSVLLNSTSPTFEVNFLYPDTSYCFVGNAYNPVYHNQTNTSLFNTSSFSFPTLPLSLDDTPKSCNIDLSVTNDTCSGSGEIENNTFDNCFDRTGTHVNNNISINKNVLLVGDDIIIDCYSSTSSFGKSIFDFTNQRWSKGLNFNSITTQGAYVARCKSGTDASYVNYDIFECNTGADNDDMYFYALNPTIGYTEDVNYSVYTCSDQFGNCSGVLEFNNGTVDSCGDNYLFESSIDEIFISASSIYSGDDFNITVRYYDARTPIGGSLYLSMYARKYGTWYFIDDVTFGAYNHSSSGLFNQSFYWNPSSVNYDTVRFRLTQQSLAEDSCICDPSGTCYLSDHDDVSINVYPNPIPLVYNFSLYNQSWFYLDLNLTQRTKGYGSLFVYDSNCSSLLFTQSIDSNDFIWTDDEFQSIINVNGLTPLTEYCFQSRLTWNGSDYNSTYETFSTSEIMYAPLEMECYYNSEPYYFIDGFDMLCKPNITLGSCFGKLHYDGKLIQTVPERIVLPSNEIYSRFTVNDGLVLIEFNNNNLKDKEMISASIMCYNDTRTFYYNTNITPEINNIEIGNTLIYMKDNSTFLIGGLFILLILIFMIIMWLWVLGK